MRARHRAVEGAVRSRGNQVQEGVEVVAAHTALGEVHLDREHGGRAQEVAVGEGALERVVAVVV